MRAVQECDVALGGIEDVLVSEEEKMRVLVAAVLGQKLLVAGHVFLRRRGEFQTSSPGKEDRQGQDDAQGAVEEGVSQGRAVVRERPLDLVVVVEAPQKDPQGNADDRQGGDDEPLGRQLERSPIEGVAHRKEDCGKHQKDERFFPIEALCDGRGRPRHHDRERDSPDSGDSGANASGKDDEHDPDEQGRHSRRLDDAVRDDVVEYVESSRNGRAENGNDEDDAGEERPDPQDGHEGVLALALVSQADLRRQQLARPVEAGENPGNRVIANAIDDDRQKKARGVVSDALEKGRHRQIEGSQPARDEGYEAHQGARRVNEQGKPQIRFGDEEENARPEIHAGDDPVEERGEGHLRFLLEVLQREGGTAQVDFADFEFPAPKIKRNVQAHDERDDPQAPAVVFDRKGKRGDEHDEQSDEVGRPHRQGDLQRRVFVCARFRVILCANRPSGQASQSREVVEGLGHPPDFQGGPNRYLHTEMARGEDVVGARRREGQSPADDDRKQGGARNLGEELGHVGARDRFEFAAGNEENADRHKRVERVPRYARMRFDNVNDLLHTAFPSVYTRVFRFSAPESCVCRRPRAVGGACRPKGQCYPRVPGAPFDSGLRRRRRAWRLPCLCARRRVVFRGRRWSVPCGRRRTQCD